jgi:hypothetical protein
MLVNSLATAVDPVKDTFLTILLSHISLPTSPTFLWVVTTLITPSGTPARRESWDGQDTVDGSHGRRTSTRAKQENGVSGGGFITAVQPAARAAPSFRVIMADGKFQGVKMELKSGKK